MFKPILFQVMLLPFLTCYGQSASVRALRAWENGDIPLAHELVVKLHNDSTDPVIQQLLMKTWFVQGEYLQVINLFNRMPEKHPMYRECSELAIQAFLHLNDVESALKLAKRYQTEYVSSYSWFADHPFTVLLGETCTLPFVGDSLIPYEFWPGLSGNVNGTDCLLRLDTGGSFIVTGPQAADRLNIRLLMKTRAMHAAVKVGAWYGCIDSMQFLGGPSFRNVPVIVMEGLGDYIIFGTNILEQFLTTIDYPNSRFIFTPREDEALKEAHYESLSKNLRSVPFYLWGDHYMFARGSIGDHHNLTFFFDSGLILLRENDGNIEQAAFSASKKTLQSWGIEKRFLRKSGFISTSWDLCVTSWCQSNTLIWFDQHLKDDRNFGGVRMHGLISHAWLKDYSWTIDFDRMEYQLGSP